MTEHAGAFESIAIVLLVVVAVALL